MTIRAAAAHPTARTIAATVALATPAGALTSNLFQRIETLTTNTAILQVTADRNVRLLEGISDRLYNQSERLSHLEAISHAQNALEKSRIP